MATQVAGGAAADRARGARLRPRRALRHGSRHGQARSPPRRRWNVSLEAMRIHGGYGYSKEFSVERLYRDAPLLVIGEGTNELQRIIIAKQLIERNPRMSLPLSGIRIVSVEQYGAGPFGTHAPRRPRRRGDQDRKLPAEGGDMGARGRTAVLRPPDDSHSSRAFNRNKRSLTLDLKQPRASEVFRKRWCAGSDAVFDNLRGDLPAKLGLTYAQLAQREPAHRLRPSLRLWPQRQPRGLAGLRLSDAGGSRLSVADRRAGRAAGAVGSVDGRPDDRHCTAALALLAGRRSKRARPDAGAISTSACSTSRCRISAMSRTWYLNAGAVTKPRAALAAIPRSRRASSTGPRTAGYLLMCNKEKFWPILCERLGRPEWADDPRFRTLQGPARQPRAGQPSCSTTRCRRARPRSGWSISPGRCRPRRSMICGGARQPVRRERGRHPGFRGPGARGAGMVATSRRRRCRPGMPPPRSAPTPMRCCAIAVFPERDIAAAASGEGDLTHGRRPPRPREVPRPAGHGQGRAAGDRRAEVAGDAVVQYRHAVQLDLPELLHRIVAAQRPAGLSHAPPRSRAISTRSRRCARRPG